MTLNKPTHVIVHCSDSTWGDAKVIDGWHRERKFSKIGYHYVVLNGFRTYGDVKDGQSDPQVDGMIEKGREEGEIGAHCLGYNDRSIGVCLIGAHKVFTQKQIEAALHLVNAIRTKYEIPAYRVMGHCETASGVSSGKACPTLDMDAFRGLLTRRSVGV